MSATLSYIVPLFFPRQLSKNYKYIYQYSDLLYNWEQSTSPEKTIFHNMSLSYCDKIQSMFDIYDRIFESICNPYDQISDKKNKILKQ